VGLEASAYVGLEVEGGARELAGKAQKVVLGMSEEGPLWGPQGLLPLALWSQAL
jgi:hypothetical protein